MICVKGVSKSYPREGELPLTVLKGVDFTINDFEFVTFFGPNGCGKSTLLQIIADLLSFDNGEISINNKHPSEVSKIGFVFQNYRDSLFPWKTNKANLSFPLEVKGISKKERDEQVKNFLDKVGVSIDLNSYPYQMSGGQQQLLAILRAMLIDPEVLLMDEPFASLDFQSRIEMQKKIIEIWEKNRKTVLFVSHDIDESIILSDKIILFSGRPAAVSRIIKNDLERPRNHGMVNSEKFIQIKSQIMENFQGTIFK